MTRKYEKRAHDDIVRRCKHCRITNNDMPFLVEKDTKSGRWYKHSVCMACYVEQCSERRRSYYAKHRKSEIEKSRRWNIENRDRYNSRRRKTFLEKLYGV